MLLALLRHAGEIVTKDELLEAGWPGRVVSENSLAKAISRLRQALGEDGDAIRVVHGYGYRLAAAVSFQAVSVEKVTAHPHEAERLHEGDRLPHRPGWRLGRRLGEGSAGVIFLAQSDSGETRAVKLATSEAGLRSLKREIALARYIRAVKPELPERGAGDRLEPQPAAVLPRAAVLRRRPPVGLGRRGAAACRCSTWPCAWRCACACAKRWPRCTRSASSTRT